MAKAKAQPESDDRAAWVKSVLAEFPDTPSKTLARKLYAERPEWFPNLEAARDSVRRFRGNHGERCREHTDNTAPELKRPNGKAGEKPAMPPSQAEPWEPYFIPATVRKLLVLSDIHIPFHSELALRVAVEHGVQQGCDGVLLNGDWADFFALSKYDKQPSKVKFKKEMRAVKAFLDWLRSEFPKKPIIAKAGNHEERWDRYLWNKAPEISDHEHMRLRSWLGFKKRNIEWVGDQRIVMAGKLAILHGHELPGAASAVNPARGAFLKAGDSILIGHHHRTSAHNDRSMLGRIVVCRSTGCLCELSPAFCRVSKWDHGFAVVDIDKDGSYRVHLKTIINGTVY